MKTVVKNGTKEKAIKVLKKDGSIFQVAVGEKKYEIDLEKVEEGVYSVIYKGRSINMEMIETGTPGQYKVNTLYEHYNIEVVEMGFGMLSDRKKQDELQRIKSPMSGKVVKINVKKGDRVEAGASLVILSAMKMENEIKSSGAGTVSRIEIKEGDVVREGHLFMEIKPN